MQTPRRKAGKLANLKPDPHVTQTKFNELKNKLEKLKKSHPRAAEELRRTAEMGDLSENAAYSLAKARLRHINEQIIALEDHLKKAVIIQPSKSNVVALGSKVMVEVEGSKQVYTILGSSETNPSAGIISHKSPVGSALMGHKMGDVVETKVAGKILFYLILDIS